MEWLGRTLVQPNGDGLADVDGTDLPLRNLAVDRHYREVRDIGQRSKRPELVARSRDSPAVIVMPVFRQDQQARGGGPDGAPAQLLRRIIQAPFDVIQLR